MRKDNLSYVECHTKAPKSLTVKSIPDLCTGLLFFGGCPYLIKLVNTFSTLETRRVKEVCTAHK